MKWIKIQILHIFLFLILFSGSVFAQRKSALYEQYVEDYKSLAIEHMERFKIPASITLAQGILESGAGASKFAKESNNHFGIKCHNDWKGKRIYRKDDGPNDCFRKYNHVKESYEDHSRFLAERSRYSRLFLLDIKDYRGWAVGLQKCGYATDKAYANKLINIIELYELYRHDTKSSSKSSKSKAETPARSTLKRDVYMTHGLIYVIAYGNDSFEQIAADMNFKVKDLVKYNEIPDASFPLSKGDIVYLEKKKKKADKPYYEHVVQIGESMHSISQKYGVRLSNLYKMNKNRDKDTYVPEEGDILRLR